MKVAIFLFWLTILAGALALPQSTPVTSSKTIPKKAPSGTTSAGTKTGTTKALPKTATAKTGTGGTGTPKTATAKTGTTTKTGKTISKTGKAVAKSSKKAAPVRRAGQLTPTPERYRDIQAALAAKGYLNEEPTGVWDDQSIDAMRRFQADQNIAATGKITASALIGLGLGPKTGDSQAPIPNSAPLIPPDPPAEPPPPH